jgi:DNA-binding beta-propeller fold protein YncE
MRHINVVLASLVSCTAFAGPSKVPPLASLDFLGTYRTGLFEQGAAEIVAYDPRTQRVFVVNAASTSVDVLDISNPALPTLVSTIDAGALGGDANSVAVKNGLVAVAIQAEVKTDPGVVAIYDSHSLALLATFPAGALPDMLAFSPDGKTILVANEGDPNGTRCSGCPCRR